MMSDWRVWLICFQLKRRAADCEIADRQGWGLGETLEHVVTLLNREHPST